MGRTHVLLGINFLWVLDPLYAITQSPFAAQTVAASVTGAAFGALLPDLDASSSLLQRIAVGHVYPFAIPGRLLNRRFGHRGFLHSFLALGLVVVLTSPLVAISWALWLGTSLGYLSHILGDACTKSGVRLLYPRRRVIHLMPYLLRLTTGSQAEEAVFAGLGSLALLFLLRHLWLQ